jgi:hypothetical protein
MVASATGGEHGSQRSAAFARADPPQGATIMNATHWTKYLALGIGATCLASRLEAQSLVTLSPNIIAANDMAAPGLAGVTFGGSGNFDNPVMDASGRVLFRARLLGTSGATTERGLFYGSSYATLTLLVQSGDPAPGLSGVTLNTATGNGLGGSPRFSANGTSFWGSSLTGTGVVTTNDTALFGGLPGSLALLAREGDLAPSGGSTFSTGLNNLGQQGTGVIDSGRFLFQTALVGGDVSGSTNNAAWISGTAGAYEWVQRKGDTVLGGQVISALGFVSQMNPAGQVLHDESLSLTLGNPPATAANDKVLFVWTPGSGNAKVVREGDTAPGTSGATFNVPGDSWFVNVGPCSFNRNGQTLIQASLMGGDVAGTQNDTGYFIGDGNGLSLALREGSPAPGTDANFNSLHASLMFLNDNGRIAFESALIGGTSTTSNDSGIWAGAPGALQLVAREGDPAPGLPGEFLGNLMGQSMLFNEAGQVYFNTTPTGGSGLSALYGWTPGVGLTLIVHGGDMVEVQPTIFKAVSSFGGIQFNNGDGGCLSFGANGRVALKVSFTDGTACVLTVQLPDAPYSNYCDPGYNGALACPCSNQPASVGRGCENSSATGGASIQASGNASLGTDTLSFVSAGEKPSATSILLSGTSRNSGLVFGQGVRCVGGVLKRLYTQTASGGSITVPGPGEPSVSARHAIHNDPLVAGDQRYYLVYYRDPSVLGGCSASATFNSTDAVDVTWTP